jgi:hypothetical protein
MTITSISNTDETEHLAVDDEEEDNHVDETSTTVATATAMTSPNLTTAGGNDITTISNTSVNTSSNNNNSNTTTLVYIPSKEYAWLPARILSTTLNTSNTNVKSVKGGISHVTLTTHSSSTTKTITVAVSIPKSFHEEQSLGLPSSSSSSSLHEETQTIVLPDHEVLPLQNVIHQSSNQNNSNDHGRSTTTLQIVTDLADLPFLHEVRRNTSFSFCVLFQWWCSFL